MKQIEYSELIRYKLPVTGEERLRTRRCSQLSLTPVTLIKATWIDPDRWPRADTGTGMMTMRPLQRSGRESYTKNYECLRILLRSDKRCPQVGVFGESSRALSTRAKSKVTSLVYVNNQIIRVGLI